MRAVPLALFRAWEEHSEALLREYLLVVAGGTTGYDIGDVNRGRQARILLSGAMPQGDVSDEASHVDVFLELSGDVVSGDFAMLQALLHEATRMAKDGELLTLPGLPEIISVRDWLCEQVVQQSAGATATPWDIDLADGRPVVAPAEWVGMADLPDDVAWLVGDDANHIIGSSSAARALLGWDEADIVGERIIAVIPPRLRQHHIAGFSHAIVTGNHRILGQTVAVDAWTRDGREIPVSLRLERHRGQRGRVVYVAWLEPRA